MEQEILKQIGTITNLYTNELINPNEYVKEIKYYKNEDKLIMTIYSLGNDQTKNRQMERDVIRISKIDLGIKGVKISYHQEQTINENEMRVPENTKIIAVLSGKGGVGKSNIAFNLGKSLSDNGHKTGIIDADIYGYSIPTLTNDVQELEMDEKLILPQQINDNLQMISTQHFLPDLDNKAIIWRGMKLNSLLMHFVYDVKWDRELEYMIIDMPPGTGDVLLNINNLFDGINGIYVTTPSHDAAIVAERIIQVGQDLEFNNLGIVENMAYYQVGDDKHYIFGKGGAHLLSDKYKLDILQSIPISDNLSEEYAQLAQIIEKILK